MSREILVEIHKEGSFIPRTERDFTRFGLWRQWQLPDPQGTKSGYDSGFIPMVWLDQKAEEELKAYQKANKSFGETVIMSEAYKKSQ
ncbi:MAG: hypothetical protein OXC44_07875 [Proteobacteria bacterium]|nr:hypothetical protein [Pseudomonadota bacterium]